MINILFWIFIGTLSGWIGYLATRTDKPGPVTAYLIVGGFGGLVGGVSARVLGLAQDNGFVDPSSVFNALMVSALFSTLFIVLLNFFRNASSG